MVCKNCGSENSRFATTCLNCGADLDNDLSKAPAPEETPVQRDYRTPDVPVRTYSGNAASGKKKKIVIAAIIAAVVIVGIVCAVVIPMTSLSGKIQGTWISEANSMKLVFGSDGKVSTYHNGVKTSFDAYSVDNGKKTLTVEGLILEKTVLEWNESQPDLAEKYSRDKKSLSDEEKDKMFSSWYMDGSRLYIGATGYVKE